MNLIPDMEQAILRDLQRRVLVYASTLRQAASVAAEIDWYDICKTLFFNSRSSMIT